MNGQLAKVFLKKFNEQATINKQQFIDKVAVWIAEVFLCETKIEIDYDFDPPWDSSGRTVNTGQPFDIQEYSSLDSFIENEYNGTTVPSFMSGMGLFHTNYNDELDEFITEWTFKHAEKTIDQLLEERNEVLIQYFTSHGIEHTNQTEIVELVFEDHDIDSFLVFDFSMELREAIGKMNIHLLFKIGHKQALQNLRQKQMEHQKRTEEQQINKEKAVKYWDKICKLHKLKYQRNMPHKVEKPYYDQYVYPILEMECKENSNAVNNIRLLGMFLNHQFSNSVYFKLSNFKDNR